MRLYLSLLMAFVCFRVYSQEKQSEPKKEEIKTESLNSGSLYILNGQRVLRPQGVSTNSGMDINALVNPMDIASINVLKGEIATMAYGDEGKNGVVFIATKKAPQPLCIVDGEKKLGGFGLLSTFNPNEVQSVHVLKGESAESTYGPSGKNGVIVVTTKKYAEGKSGHR